MQRRCGINFYRLKWLTLMEISAMAMNSTDLPWPEAGTGFVMPNRFTNRIQLNVTLVNPESIQVRLLDVKGTTVMRQSMTGTEGENTLSITMSSTACLPVSIGCWWKRPLRAIPSEFSKALNLRNQGSRFARIRMMSARGCVLILGK